MTLSHGSRRASASLNLALAVLVATALALTASMTRAADRSCTDAKDVAETRASILTVERSLRAAPVASLTDATRLKRTEALDELHRYAVAGVFPHNHESVEPHAIFVDQHGTLCAFANLLAFSGRRDFVDHVAAVCNHAKVAQLAQEPAVTEWALESGITVDEAARIQRPAYSFTPAPSPVDVLSPVPAAIEAVADASAPVQASAGGAVLALVGGAMFFRRRSAARPLPMP